jgi:hypothetical protein
VSIYAIISDPQRFHGREVLTAGFGLFSDGVTSLLASLEDRDYLLFLNGLGLDLSGCVDREWVLAEGDRKACWLRGVIDAGAVTSNSSPVQYAATLRVIKCTMIHGKTTPSP